MLLSIVILAAGKGTRMKSSLPKVLHKLAGKPLLGHVIDTARKLNPNKICIVYGHGGEALPEAFVDQNDLVWVLQEPQLGTGHAVQQALDAKSDSDVTLILYGDVPLTPTLLLGRLVDSVSDTGMGLLTASSENPSSYGRIIRNAKGDVVAIVEEKDANDAQLQITEINTGIMALPTQKLCDWLKQVTNNNAQGEYYLTDVIALAVANSVQIHTQHAFTIEEVSGINSRQQLVELERYLQTRIAAQLSEHGVTIRDPARFDVRGDLKIGQDVDIDVNVIFEGQVSIGNNVSIESNCIIRDCVIGDDVKIFANSVLERSQVESGCNIGPFARLRPETVLKTNVKVGNFVEIKESVIGHGSKVNHLSYIGDSLVGKDVNVGAGTITCNYDGANKHQTIIEDGVFIGSDTQLVAPVKIGKNVTIGAGSTITKDVQENRLALSRTKQISLDNWVRPTKQKK